ncbi:MAG: hypothetical protein ACI4XR_01990 [Bacilli bacterium]
MEQKNYKNVKVVALVASIFLLFIIFASAFAYFGSFNLNLNNNVSVNIYAQEGGAASFTTTAAQLNLQVPASAMSQSNSETGNAVLAAENTATLNVTLKGAEGMLTTCTYNIIYEYDNTSETYGNSVAVTSGADKEITLEVSGLNGKYNYYETERNFNYYSGSNGEDTTDVWNSATKRYLVKEAKIRSTGSEETAKWKITGRYYNLDVSQSQLEGKSFTGKIYVDPNYDCITEDLPTENGYNLVLTQNGGATAIEAKTVDLSTIATTNEGMHAYNEGSGKTYYYRGAVDNNWVKYGKFKEDFVVYRGFRSQTTDTSSDVWFNGSGINYKDYNSLSECNNGYNSEYNYNCKAITLAETGDDMYWRIIRIDGSNQIRMIYTGNTPPSKSTSVVMTGAKTMMGMSAYNTEYNHAEYVGFQYTSGSQRGTSTNSTIKTYLNNWYTKYFQDNNISRKVSTTFCNDRNTSSTWASTGSYIEYAALGRLDATPPVPTFDCNTNDLFIEDLGLITADEMVLAGAKFFELNANFYLNNEMAYWSASPSEFNGDYVGVVVLNPIFGLLFGSVDIPVDGVRGVVTLSSNAKLSGSGTYDDVFIVS